MASVPSVACLAGGIGAVVLLAAYVGMPAQGA